MIAYVIFTTPDLGAQELEAIKRINALRGELRWALAEPRRWLGGLRRLAFARAVQRSNSIEGYDASLDDVLAALDDQEPMDAEAETSLALQGYRDALTYVLQIADEDGLEVDEGLLRALHFMMIKYDLSKRPGRWRAGAIYVRREPEGKIVYEGPDHSLVPDLIDELKQSLKQDGDPVVVRAAMAHLNLVMIHPFADGNGRMSRCLQTMVLTREKILDPVFSTIEEYLGSNTEAYYRVLGEVGGGSWQPERNARSWVRFCLNAHYQQGLTHQWRITEAGELWDGCLSLVELHDLPERAVGPLCDAARGLRLRNALYRSVVRDSEGEEIDMQTASRDLRELVSAGLLEARGETRGRHYVGTPRLFFVRMRIHERNPKPSSVELFMSDEQLSLLARE